MGCAMEGKIKDLIMGGPHYIQTVWTGKMEEKLIRWCSSA